MSWKPTRWNFYCDRCGSWVSMADAGVVDEATERRFCGYTCKYLYGRDLTSREVRYPNGDPRRYPAESDR